MFTPLCHLAMFLSFLFSIPSVYALLIPTTYVVTGASGRVGSIVVSNLLNLEADEQKGLKVIALSTNITKATSILPPHPSLSILPYSLTSIPTTQPCTLIHCSSDLAKFPDIVRSLQGYSRFKGRARRIGRYVKSRLLRRSGRPCDLPPSTSTSTPTSTSSIILLSSAGVTRPSWSTTKSKRYPQSHDIPIIRLNPGGVLDRKFESEEYVRSSNIPYTIVRPVGLKSEDVWPPGRPVLTQGDYAVGRCTPSDLAYVITSSCASESKGWKRQGLTFEVQTLTGYPRPRDGMENVFDILTLDGYGLNSDDAGYGFVQQLLPG
eukprot:CAMPEP_0118655054 /NCGR_PEP_ID=MMETSP0785-20121206/12717_1 /TAXON_ID=91992 /ORGANISM="Bolidomonas pacifica, Strain CCMP 1866" /LENGTH=319 /DNA_ID=CAMNT_0006547753 /DNA_START=34 /DNA_END=989 /DNA_ORIENTATION=+